MHAVSLRNVRGRMATSWKRWARNRFALEVGPATFRSHSQQASIRSGRVNRRSDGAACAWIGEEARRLAGQLIQFVFDQHLSRR